MHQKEARSYGDILAFIFVLLLFQDLLCTYLVSPPPPFHIDLVASQWTN